jgi:hypothetical protein
VRDRGVDRAPAGSVVRRERFAAPAAADLVLAAAAHEVVVFRIDREQHSEVPVGIGVEHQHVAILAGPHLHLGLFAREEPTVAADPDLDRRIVAARGLSGRARRCTGKEER